MPYTFYFVETGKGITTPYRPLLVLYGENLTSQAAQELLTPPKYQQPEVEESAQTEDILNAAAISGEGRVTIFMNRRIKQPPMLPEATMVQMLELLKERGIKPDREFFERLKPFIMLIRNSGGVKDRNTLLAEGLEEYLQAEFQVSYHYDDQRWELDLVGEPAQDKLAAPAKASAEPAVIPQPEKLEKPATQREPEVTNKPAVKPERAVNQAKITNDFLDSVLKFTRTHFLQATKKNARIKSQLLQATVEAIQSELQQKGNDETPFDWLHHKIPVKIPNFQELPEHFQTLLSARKTQEGTYRCTLSEMLSLQQNPKFGAKLTDSAKEIFKILPMSPAEKAIFFLDQTYHRLKQQKRGPADQKTANKMLDILNAKNQLQAEKDNNLELEHILQLKIPSDDKKSPTKSVEAILKGHRGFHLFGPAQSYKEFMWVMKTAATAPLKLSR